MALTTHFGDTVEVAWANTVIVDGVVLKNRNGTTGRMVTSFEETGERRYPREDEQYIWVGEPGLVHCNVADFEDEPISWTGPPKDYIILRRIQ